MKNLRMGDHGEKVKDLNDMLKSLEYRASNLSDEFDIRTRCAVEAFQNDHGLIISGVVDTMTWERLEKNVPKKLEEAPISATQTSSRPTLRQGNTGVFVTELQNSLVRLGFLSGVADGIFGSKTASAVRAFQSANELTADGVVGNATWDTIDRLLAALPPSSTAGRPTIRQGSTGTSVKELQLLLKTLGFYNGEPDGAFGSQTAAAVRAFQSSRGLSPDGVVGPNTWREIDNALAAVPPPVTPPTSRPTLREGSRGDEVALLQRQLRALGYYTGVDDGVFGPNTAAAVRRFQSANGLSADGVVGVNTWLALDRATQGPQENLPTIREGSTGNYVLILQEKLKFLGYFPGSITGSFGPETTTAVKEFQRNNGLVADGVVGEKTWIILFSETATPPPPNLPGTLKPNLRYGDTGNYVSYLQTELKLLMYYNDNITGNFDWNTAVAVKAFQDVNGLTPDGVVGRRTWYALDTLYPPPVKCN